jgi:hypothetical protein
LQQLGITEAEVSQASRLPNPGFSFGRMTKGDEIELERGLHFNLGALADLALVSRLEERRLQSGATRSRDGRAQPGRRHPQGLGTGRRC